MRTSQQPLILNKTACVTCLLHIISAPGCTEASVLSSDSGGTLVLSIWIRGPIQKNMAPHNVSLHTCEAVSYPNIPILDF